MSMKETSIIVLLTLKRHEDGIWIRRLVRSLTRMASNNNTNNTKMTTTSIEVLALEDWMSQGLPVSSQSLFPSKWIGIVNRVSDAAPPPLFKACCAILNMAVHIYKIPVINGPTSYAQCANKWCQHVLFHQAGLSSPATTAYWNTKEEHVGKHPLKGIPAISQKEEEKRSDDANANLLVKPNAGGFGAGISKVPKSQPLLATLENSIFDDGFTLVQDFIPSDKVYRVWFWNGKVQCAVERPTESSSSEFTGGCAGACSARPPVVMTAWAVPNDVRLELEDQLLPLLADVHCGSVELLYSSAGERLYFDLNLLSTLPIVKSIPNAESVWGSDYDPWDELAEGIWNMIQRENRKAVRHGGG